MRTTRTIPTPTGLADDKHPFTLTIYEDEGIPMMVEIAYPAGTKPSVTFTLEAFFQMVDTVRDAVGRPSNSSATIA